MGDDKIRSFRDLAPWQKSMELAERVHGATAAFPQEGDEIAARMRDAAITIPAAISEAFALESTTHLIGTVAPIAELETCVELAKRLEFLAEDLADDLAGRVEAIALAIGEVFDEVDPDLEDEDGDYPGKPRPDHGPRDHGPRGERHDHGYHQHHGNGRHDHGYHGQGDCGCEPPRRHNHHHHDDRCEPRRGRRRHRDDYYCD